MVNITQKSFDQLTQLFDLVTCSLTRLPPYEAAIWLWITWVRRKEVREVSSSTPVLSLVRIFTFLKTYEMQTFMTLMWTFLTILQYHLPGMGTASRPNIQQGEEISPLISWQMEVSHFWKRGSNQDIYTVAVTTLLSPCCLYWYLPPCKLRTSTNYWTKECG